MNLNGTSIRDNLMDDHSAKRIKLEIWERPLNFAISPEEYEALAVKKAKLPRDPMSHRIIEKRRRDRMNNCLAELSRLIPPNYLKQGQGRIEKTEIIEIASKLIRNLQNLHNFREMMEKELPLNGGGTNPCCLEKYFMGFKECQEETAQYLVDSEGMDPKDSFCQRMVSHLDQTSKKFVKSSKEMMEKELPLNGGGTNPCCLEKYFMGFKECQEETAQYLVDSEGMDPKDSFCQRMVSHLDQTSKKFVKSSKAMPDARDMKSDDSVFPSNNTQSSDSSYQGLNISDNNMKMINQDEHLRTLLKPRSKDNSASQTSGYCSSGGLSVFDSGTSSCITLQSVQRDSAEKEAASGYGGSQYSSEQNSLFGSMTNKDCRKCNVYKFKHNITKRFSEEGKPFQMKSDTSSNDSREEDNEQNMQSYRLNNMDRRSLGTESTQYPSSSSDSGNSYSGKHKTHRYQKTNDNSGNGQFDSKKVSLPAFVLHPVGTHYVPVTIHQSYFQALFASETKASTAYHSISIPVNFCGPSVSIPTQVEQTLPSSTEELPVEILQKAF